MLTFTRQSPQRASMLCDKIFERPRLFYIASPLVKFPRHNGYNPLPFFYKKCKLLEIAHWLKVKSNLILLAKSRWDGILKTLLCTYRFRRNASVSRQSIQTDARSIERLFKYSSIAAFLTLLLFSLSLFRLYIRLRHAAPAMRQLILDDIFKVANLTCS